MSSIPPAAIALWRRVRAIQARGELGELDVLELRAALNELGHALKYDGLRVEPHRVGDQPWNWIGDNQVQLERWQEGKEIRDALNAALLAETGRLSTAAAPRHVSSADASADPRPRYCG